MPDFAVQGRVYNGSLLAANLLSQQQTLVLSSFGATTSSTLTDENDKITVGETVTLDGVEFTMIGTGTAQPGINVLGVTVPTGTPVDLIVMQSSVTGDFHFIFPDGLPNALGMIALVVDVDAVGYDFGTDAPLCFAAGTLIQTMRGLVPVEALRPGTALKSADGTPLIVRAVLETTAPEGPAVRHLPVRIEANTFGPGMPKRTLRVSQQHRLPISGGLLETCFAMTAALAPAVAFINFDGVRLDIGGAAPRFHHLLCDRHGLVFAEGLAAETLLASAEDAPVALKDETALPCLPVLTLRETRMLLRAAGAPRSGSLRIGCGSALAETDLRMFA